MKEQGMVVMDKYLGQIFLPAGRNGFFRGLLGLFFGALHGEALELHQYSTTMSNRTKMQHPIIVQSKLVDRSLSEQIVSISEQSQLFSSSGSALAAVKRTTNLDKRMNSPDPEQMRFSSPDSQSFGVPFQHT